jgi:hypothetical protein
MSNSYISGKLERTTSGAPSVVAPVKADHVNFSIDPSYQPVLYLRKFNNSSIQ